MLVFFNDKIFEGLLTAVFDVYSRKIFPDKLLGEESIAILGMEDSYNVISQEDKAERVWAAIENKISKQACNMLTNA